jgi:hypothetical protein
MDKKESCGQRSHLASNVKNAEVVDRKRIKDAQIAREILAAAEPVSPAY